jgi:hypothetical protein
VTSNTELPDENPDDEGDTQVGYGRPPKTTRFKKGESGNPKGRPKGSLNVATILMKTLRERVVINENGQRRTVTKLEAAVKQLTNKAASGNLQSLRLLLDLARDAEANEEARREQTPVFSGLDQEVIEGIMKRFQEPQHQAQQLEEIDNGDDQSS